MKNFLKKYPKRIITAFLVVLLIAVVGTANNYKTYGKTDPEHYLSEEIVEFMREIYGDITIVNTGWYSDLYYGEMNLKSREWYRKNNIERLITIEIDSDEYAPDGTVKVKIDNKMLDDVDFYKGKYVLEKCFDGAWYIVHSGKIGNESHDLISLHDGESYEFEIPLNSVREVSDEPLTLIKGEYRMIIPVYVLNEPEKGESEDKLFSFNFDII